MGTVGSRNSTKDITGNRLLRLAYREMFKGKSTKLNLSKVPSAKIGDDSDGHKTRESFMDYKLVKETSLEGNKWIIALGKAYESYVSGSITDCVLAFPLNERARRGVARILGEMNIEERIVWEGMFHHSGLLVGRSDGQIGVLNNNATDYFRFAGAVGQRMYGLRNFVRRPAEFDKDLVSLSTMDRVVQETTLYNPEAVKFLANQLEATIVDKANFMAKHRLYK